MTSLAVERALSPFLLRNHIRSPIYVEENLTVDLCLKILQNRIRMIGKKAYSLTTLAAERALSSFLLGNQIRSPIYLEENRTVDLYLTILQSLIRMPEVVANNHDELESSVDKSVRD